MTATGLDGLTIVVLAKRPAPGRVKTRLVRAGRLDPAGAAVLAAALLRCLCRRLAPRARLVLAVTPDGAGPALAASIGLPGLEVTNQGPGDLGMRLERVWRAAAGDGPVALLGADAPDVPLEALASIPAALARADAAIGPSEDGGYWVLAGREPRPALLRRIDWGSDRVYDQTCRRAGDAGVVLARLPAWRDVDRPEDLDALRRRLLARRTGADPTDDAAFAELLDLLGSLETPPGTEPAAPSPDEPRP